MVISGVLRSALIVLGFDLTAFFVRIAGRGLKIYFSKYRAHLGEKGRNVGAGEEQGGVA
jgi:hypothetical protein